METRPQITTIIPTYQRPQLLKRAIESVLAQTYPHLQVLVLDNASQDNTEEIVRECIRKDSRVIYHRHPENLGMLGNYSYGLSQVKSDYFSLLSDDDVMFPWFYEEVLKGCKEFPDIAFSAGSALIMDEKGKIVHVPLDLWKREGKFSPPEGFIEMIAKYPVPSCILFHRKVLEAATIDIENSLTWDCDYLLQIASRFPFYLSKRPCGIFLHHESSYSNSRGFDNWSKALHRMMTRISANPHLDSKTKEQGIGLIHSGLKGMNRPFIFRSLIHRKTNEAYAHAIAYGKSEGVDLKTWILIHLTRLCTWFPFLVPLLLWVRDVKIFINGRSFRRYKHYAKWLNT